MTVRLVMKYLVSKLHLDSESEVFLNFFIIIINTN